MNKYKIQHLQILIQFLKMFCNLNFNFVMYLKDSIPQIHAFWMFL